tara:strand:- start:334 stop:1041 length:708 start_codon:yes stop_codon:yes gene_type:complete
MDINEKKNLVNSYNEWFHSIDFGDGVISNGAKDLETIHKEFREWNFPKNYFENKDVLDIGAWDGIHSFYAEENGAKSVTALDGFIWANKSWAGKKGFDIAKKIKKSNVKELIVDIETPEFNETNIGKFDCVIFAGVLYHLKNPVGAIEKLSKIIRPGGSLFLETTYSDNLEKINEPILEFHPKDSFNNDSSNYFTANSLCVKKILEEFDFKIIKMYPTSIFPKSKNRRLVVYCTK